MIKAHSLLWVFFEEPRTGLASISGSIITIAEVAETTLGYPLLLITPIPPANLRV